MPSPSTSLSPPRLALIACQVLETEIAALTEGESARFVHREYFEIGLHDQPTVLRARLAEAIERAEAEPAVDAVVLVYGLCGMALVELGPRRCPLVVPRAHDCLTLFLGSKERYADCMRAEPGTYWYTPGWCRGGRVPGPEREAQLRSEYTAKYGAETAEALLEMEREAFGQHACAGYVDFGLPGDAEYRRYAEACAGTRGWRFAAHRGDPQLLRELLQGGWDADRFLVVQPGERIAYDTGQIMKAVRVEPGPGGAS